ncbi:28S rRNA (cytosine-C(5))-methyltransferase-like isoform X2 [Acropora muricata]|uniref:28S rRNA (cytosine-C(5))-methyltransferase-like isoform X2 n=1 Tax=Acropora muricata TaxID=159855 RepID=UPI0034E5C8A1
MATLYSSAASVIEKVIKKRGTIKSLAIASHFPQKKKLYALVCETLKYKTIIEEIFEQTQLLKLEKKLRYNHALVLVYDFLFGQGIQCGGELKQYITKHKSALQSSLVRLKIKAKVHKNEDLLPKEILHKGLIPRFARVNTIKTSKENVIQQLKENGFEQVDVTNIASFLSQSKALQTKEFISDKHIPDLLVFPPGTDLHDHPLYVSGEILLQDKASCLPAHILLPPPGSHVIDACAAPGNKTSHLASIMSNQGKIFAFDSDKKRLAVMQKLMKKAGVDCVTTKNCSFLEVNPSDEKYSNVEYILVDPSCSGSGIASRMDKFVDEEQETDAEKQRLESLAKFQLSILNHALSFPSVKRAVYSTCSIHQEENEDVVEAALKAKNDRFTLEHCLPSWTHRGKNVFQGAEKCIRASPDEDNTNGFFVALFARKASESGNTEKLYKDSRKGRKRNLNSEDEETNIPAAKLDQEMNKAQLPLNKENDKFESNGEHLPSQKKRRKKKKKSEESKSQELQVIVPKIAKTGSNNVKKKRKPKKKNKKVPVFS